jgi:hypothetical protein
MSPGEFLRPTEICRSYLEPAIPLPHGEVAVVRVSGIEAQDRNQQTGVVLAEASSERVAIPMFRYLGRAQQVSVARLGTQLASSDSRDIAPSNCIIRRYRVIKRIEDPQICLEPARCKRADKAIREFHF